jgi:phosphatidylglycerophosphate synthase
MLKEDLATLKKICYKADEKEKPLYAQIVTHRFSILAVKLIGGTQITPNQVTFFSIILGLSAAILFAIGKSLSFLAGAFFLEFYYIFDAVDGQLARYKKSSSLSGAYFDYISNHIVQSLVFLSIGYGLFSHFGEVSYLILGIFSSLGMIFMYVIYDARYNILFARKNNLSQLEKYNENIKGPNNISFLKRIFMILHWFCRYPTIMNMITVTAVSNLLLIIFKLSEELILFRWLMVFYAIALNVVWMFKLSKAILTKELD